MPEKIDFTRWQRYVRALADELGLRDWEIDVRTGNVGDDGNDAEIDVGEVRRAAHVMLNHKTWPGKSPEEKRWTLVHELLHCHLAPILLAVHRTEVLMGEERWALFKPMFDDIFERATDDISQAVAKRLPPPSAYR